MIESLVTVVEFVTTFLSAIVKFVLFLFSRLILLIFIVSVIMILLAFLRARFLPNVNKEESTSNMSTTSHETDTKPSEKETQIHRDLHVETKELGTPLRSDAFYEAAWEELKVFF